jgi:threonine synthase
MTTVKNKNVFNIAVEGNFDDCQNLVKSMFSDQEFSGSINMSGVNSINWARIIAQTVYYFFAYFLLKKEGLVNFSVPTGNFGDVYAGYLSKKMGLPINKLIVATNQNDILHRAISNGKYEAETVSETISPSMDIQIASNFERLIYDVNNFNDVQTKNVMSEIKIEGKYIISKDELEKINKDFLSASMNEAEVLNVIKEVYEKHNVVLDPHSAIGFGALTKVNLEGNKVVLATAHPCKFPDAIDRSINIKPNLPSELMYVMDEKENYDIIPNNLNKIKQYIKNKIK